MPMTRRQFSALTAAGVSLVVLGPAACGDNAQPQPQAQENDREKNKANLADAPFFIGPPKKFHEARLYDEFKHDKGVWIVNDGKTLVALSATCTHQGCTTRWNAEDQQFVCPCHKSRFALDGANDSGKAKRPLERCAVRLTPGPDGTSQIEVDPTRRFRKDRDEWSNPDSSLPLTS